MKLAVATAVAFALAIAPSNAIAAGSPNVGGKCSKIGQKSGSLICKKINGKLAWRSSPPSKSVASVTAADLQSGLVRADYDGYYEDDFSWFARNKPQATGVGRDEIDVHTHVGDNFSIQWTGYLIPTESGIWSFSTISDDGSQLWLGSAAIDAVPEQPGALSAPGIHGPVTISRTVSMLKGHLYPLRIQFGDKTNWAQITLTVKAPSWAQAASVLPGLLWHSPVSSEPASGIDPEYARTRMAAETTLPRSDLPGLTPSSSFEPEERCRLRVPDAALTSEVRRGFPRSQYRLPTSGSVRGIAIFIEFADAKGAADIEARFAAYTQEFIKFYAAQSYGKVNVRMDVVPRYIAIPNSSSKYGMQTHNGGNPWQYVRDALDAADPTVDFSPYDFALIIPPVGTSEIVYGPAFPTNAEQLRTSEKILYSATVAGSDSIKNPRGQWWWTAHEVGHLFGLEHQYSWSSITYEAQLLGIWDLMETGDNAPELLAWHRYLLGWIGADSAHCIDKAKAGGTSSVHLLAPIESQKSGTKAIIVRLSDEEALVIESRRGMGFDSISELDEGALVYRVNVANHDSAQEALIVTQTSWPKGSTVAGTLRPGEWVADSGVTVKVLASTLAGDYVEVTIGD